MKLLIQFALENNIILNINEKSYNGKYLLLWVCNDINMPMVHLLIRYATKFNIILDINEKDVN